MHRTLFALAFVATSSIARAQPVAVTLTEFKVALTKDTVKAGPTTFRVKNAGTIAHGFWVLGDGVDKGSATINAGQEVSVVVTLKPGVYEVYCPMSDNSHKLGGMTHKLVVTAAAAPAKPAAVPPKKKAARSGRWLQALVLEVRCGIVL